MPSWTAEFGPWRRDYLTSDDDDDDDDDDAR
jgi:hypothetical protein